MRKIKKTRGTCSVGRFRQNVSSPQWTEPVGAKCRAMQSPATASMCHFKDRNKHTTPQPRRAFLKWKFCGAGFSRCKQSWQAKTSPKQQSSAPLAECQTDGTFFLKSHSFDSWKGTNGQIVLSQSWQFLFSFLMKQLWRARCLCAIWWCKNIYRSKKWTFLSVKKRAMEKTINWLTFCIILTASAHPPVTCLRLHPDLCPTAGCVQCGCTCRQNYVL